MSAEWYYGQNGNRGGPVELAELQNMVRAGQLGAEDLVWRAGMANWEPAAKVGELSASFVAPAPSHPAPHAGGYAQQHHPQPQQPPAWTPPQQQQGYPQQQGYGASHGGPYAGQPGAHGQYIPIQTTGTATTAMVLGILSLFMFCFPLGIIALIMGLQSKNGAGRGMAIAGIVTGLVSIVLSGLFFLLILAAEGF